jgi:hypothetical protein
VTALSHARQGRLCDADADGRKKSELLTPGDSGFVPAGHAHACEVGLDVFEDADHTWLGSPGAARQAVERTVDVLCRGFGLRG